MQKHYKILLGGSPCTYWSISQSSDKRETEASGLGWELFKNFLIAKEKFKPDYFLYENNKSAAQPIKEQISKELGVPLQYINSALVSAQNRQRFYCHNIPNVQQPADRGILLKDILESGLDLTQNEKSYALTTRCQGAIPDDTIQKHRHSMVAEPVIFQEPHGYNKGGIKYDKSPTMTTAAWEHNNKAVEPICIGTIEPPAILRYERTEEAKKVRKDYESGKVKHGFHELHELHPRADGESNTLSTVQKDNMLIESWDGKTYPVYEVKNGLITIKDKQYPIKLPDGYYIIRKLTVNECRRLQTVPDWYKMPCSNSQNYKMLGNGWTIEVIKHILSYIPGIKDCTVEVLSMYSGMNCDLIALTELGAKIVRCVDYEIDKYAIKTSSANFPYIEQRGDAFQLRNTNWSF